MKTRVVMLAILALLSLIGLMCPLGYWFINSELTRMELFKEFWWLFLVGGGVFVYCVDTLKSILLKLKKEEDEKV